jgi:hypothetical protein
MITLLASNSKPLVVTESDLAIGPIAWGFTLGFGFLTCTVHICQIPFANSRVTARDSDKANLRDLSKTWHLQTQHSVRLDDLVRDLHMPDILHNLLAPLGRCDNPKVI